MAYVYVYIKEPLKYEVKYAAIQVLIQLRTWGRATHSGFIIDLRIEEFIELMKKWKQVPAKVIDAEFAGVHAVSARFPKVTTETLTEMTNCRLFIKRAKLTKTQKNKLMKNIQNSLHKKSYSVVGLVWFAIAPFIDVIKRTRDVDPDGGFCSEYVTNMFYRVGFPVFNFMCDDVERIILDSRKMKLSQILKKYEGVFPEEDLVYLYEFANDEEKSRMIQFGYKVSPKMLKLTPTLEPVCVIDIKGKGKNKMLKLVQDTTGILTQRDKKPLVCPPEHFQTDEESVDGL